MLTAMATAFADDGSVDLDGTARIAAHLVDHGNDGVVVSGTTGESPTTTVDEDGQILAAVKDAVGDRASVVAGVGTNATAHSVELAEQADKVGADGLLLVTPYYNKPSQAGVLAPLPHGRRGQRPAGDAVRRAAAHRHHDRARDLRAAPRAASTVVAVKDAVGDLPRAASPSSDLGYAVYSGDDAPPSATWRTAAAGWSRVVGHVAGDEPAAMIDAFLAGDHAEALATYTRLLPAFDAMMGVPNYGATTAKAALQLLGVLDNRNVRGPARPAHRRRGGRAARRPRRLRPPPVRN